MNFDYGHLDFIRRKSASEESVLLELEKVAKERKVPIIKPETARFLEVMCLLKRPRKILEIGTAIGYSSIVMALALAKKVSIDTIEIRKRSVETAREYIKNYGLADNIHVIFGDAMEVLMCLKGSYDLIFMDAAKGQYLRYLPDCIRLLEKDGLIITDNIFCQGLVPEEDISNVKRRKRTMVRKTDQYVDLIMKHPALKTSLIHLGDGVSLSVRRMEEA